MQLAQGMANAGHAVMIVCGQDGPVAETYRSDGRFRVEICPLAYTDWRHPLRFWHCVRRLRKLFSDHRADVLHANDIPSYQAASLAAKQLSIPRVSHARFLLDSEEGARWFLRYGCERVISVSDYLKGHLEEVSGELFSGLVDVSRDGIKVPDPPTDDDRIKAREQLGLDFEKYVFLFFGQFTPVKGLEELIPAIGQLGESVRSKAAFYLIGDDLQNDGQYRRQMQELADRVVEGVLLEFPGFRRDVPEWLKACNCVLVPSRIDPLGMSAMESMASARAVIGSRVGGIPEMIDHGNTGMLVDSSDILGLTQAMEKMSLDSNRADQMGLAGHQRAKELFSLERHVADIESIYRQVIAGHRG